MNFEIAKFLCSKGAQLLGYADLKDISELPCGIVVGIALPRHIMVSAKDVPSAEYLKCYNEINDKLDYIVTEGANYLITKGYKAVALTREYAGTDYSAGAKLPVKTVATRAGIGFVGKSANLVTRLYGSAIRLSSIITDYELECGTPVTQGDCGACTMCKDNCPGGAINGVLWKTDTDRDALVDINKCMKTMTAELGEKGMDAEHAICGKCIAICPFTSMYAR
jgi:epoxyqueuosine reductase QueG